MPYDQNTKLQLIQGKYFATTQSDVISRPPNDKIKNKLYKMYIRKFLYSTIIPATLEYAINDNRRKLCDITKTEFSPFLKWTMAYLYVEVYSNNNLYTNAFVTKYKRILKLYEKFYNKDAMISSRSYSNLVELCNAILDIMTTRDYVVGLVSGHINPQE